MHHVPSPARPHHTGRLLFIVLVWVVGKAVSRAGMPMLVGEIGVGVVMGPNLLNLVPWPQALKLHGEVGPLWMTPGDRMGPMDAEIRLKALW